MTTDHWVRANNTSEWVWKMFFIYLVVSAIGIPITTFLSVIHCYFAEGKVNPDHLYRNGKMVCVIKIEFTEENEMEHDALFKWCISVSPGINLHSRDTPLKWLTCLVSRQYIWVLMGFLWLDSFRCASIIRHSTKCTANRLRKPQNTIAICCVIQSVFMRRLKSKCSMCPTIS